MGKEPHCCRLLFFIPNATKNIVKTSRSETVDLQQSKKQKNPINRLVLLQLPNCTREGKGREGSENEQRNSPSKPTVSVVTMTKFERSINKRERPEKEKTVSRSYVQPRFQLRASTPPRTPKTHLTQPHNTYYTTPFVHSFYTLLTGNQPLAYPARRPPSTPSKTRPAPPCWPVQARCD